jgi:hypothetical protein
MSRTDFNTLLEAGAHFGHLKRKWNPKMAPYIFMEKNGIHIIDLHKTVLKIDESYMKRCTKEVAAYRGTTTYGDGYSGYGYGRDYSKGTGWNSQYSFLDTLTHAEESAIVLAETILGESPDLSGVRDDVLLYALSLEYKEINEYIKELEVDGRSAVSRFRTCYEGSLPKTRPADEPKVETDQNVPTGGPDEGHPSGCAIQPAVEREDGTADSGTADSLGTESRN